MERKRKVYFWTCCLVSASCILANFLPGSRSARALARARKLRADATLTEMAMVDKLFASAPTGNVFLFFDGLDPDSTVDMRLVTTLAYRGSFTLYPRRVFVDERMTPILQRSLLTERDRPSVAWLRENGVHYVFEVQKRDGVILPTRIHKVAP